MICFGSKPETTVIKEVSGASSAIILESFLEFSGEQEIDKEDERKRNG